ncbi:hypothetical protein ElyMa_006067900, partial [Elysia marginata]
METDTLNQRDIDNVRKAMWRQRRKHQPKLPTTRTEALYAMSKINPKHEMAFHRKLNGLFYHSHPPIFELVDRLEEIVFEISFKIREGPARPPKASERRKRAWLESIIAKYQAETVTTEQFLKK